MATEVLRGVKTIEHVGPREVRLIRRRLVPRREQPITQEELARFLGVSWSTVSRWKTGASRPDPNMQKKLKRLWLALELLDDMVESGQRIAFFEQRHPLLMGLRPIDLLNTEEGTELVVNLLVGAASGSFA